MKQIQKKEKKSLDKFLLTGCFLICLSAGWLIGSETAEAFSQSREVNCIPVEGTTVLPAITSHGEALPTIILKEFSVVAPEKEKTTNK